MSILPDLIAPNLKLVFCGTALSTTSARRRAYYAGPGNAFWPTLHTIGLTPRRFEPEEYPLLLDLRIGLTDLSKSQSGADSVIQFSNGDRERLRKLIKRYRPEMLAFTSLTAARTFFQRHQVSVGEQIQSLGTTRVFVLPSPSGRARRTWSIEPWRELASRVCACSVGNSRFHRPISRKAARSSGATR
ncbi:MAG: mismatch-specific DNA-glycosylase [Candidatus Zixiibacteriota bacterium]